MHQKGRDAIVREKKVRIMEFFVDILGPFFSQKGVPREGTPYHGRPDLWRFVFPTYAVSPRSMENGFLRLMERRPFLHFTGKPWCILRKEGIPLLEKVHKSALQNSITRTFLPDLWTFFPPLFENFYKTP